MALTHDNKPAHAEPILSSLGNVESGGIYSFDVSRAIAGDGIYSFAITSTETDGSGYNSRENPGAHPELVLEWAAANGNGAATTAGNGGASATSAGAGAGSGAESKDLDPPASGDGCGCRLAAAPIENRTWLSGLIAATFLAGRRRGRRI
jgi:hypothetical protein